jgi:hypothetical protein
VESLWWDSLLRFQSAFCTSNLASLLDKQALQFEISLLHFQSFTFFTSTFQIGIHTQTSASKPIWLPIWTSPSKSSISGFPFGLPCSTIGLTLGQTLQSAVYTSKPSIFGFSQPSLKYLNYAAPEVETVGHTLGPMCTSFLYMFTNVLYTSGYRCATVQFVVQHATPAHP